MHNSRLFSPSQPIVNFLSYRINLLLHLFLLRQRSSAAPQAIHDSRKNFTVRFYFYDLSSPSPSSTEDGPRVTVQLVGRKISPSSPRPQPKMLPPGFSLTSLSPVASAAPPSAVASVARRRRHRRAPPPPLLPVERHLGLGGRPPAPPPRRPRVSARNRPWPGLSGAPAWVACSRRWSATNTPRR